MTDWISVDERLPDSSGKVLATYINDHGWRRTICAHYIPRFTILTDGEIDTRDEYNEQLDEYFICEGWYEVMENALDYSAVFVGDEVVTHWMELPDYPEESCQIIHKRV